MNPGSTHEAVFKLFEWYHSRIVHDKFNGPTLLFVGDLCGPVELETWSRFRYVGVSLKWYM